MDMRAILDRLIGFETVSHMTNLPLLRFVEGLLAEAGIPSTLIFDETGEKANLWARVGPADVPGVILSGHVDVVPVEGQAWTRPAFEVTQEGSRLYGRGTTDMKGFDACAIACMLEAAKRDLKVPLILALSHDEEIGCRGVGSMIDAMAEWSVPPRLCIVGEPTSMEAAIGHKGKVALRVTCQGRAGHSSLAPQALNAIHMAMDFGMGVRALQAEVAATGPSDADYDVPYTTLHMGKITGGVQVNVVAHQCVIDMEIRSLAQDDPQALIARVEAVAEAVVAPLRNDFPEAAITVERLWDYPGLGTEADADVVSFVKGLTGGNTHLKVAYGTEGGMFAQRLGLPTVICGPGAMAQGHMPDEYVELAQLQRCEAMMAALLARCEAGF
ncbi:acetylornithine deacetylase [Pseudorhodobacter wandonensis]|jgi:acetylornithine deacetylase|uniref:acetylornithine deacetylase n=1 Tax=Pseudorhodobacter wandonensis TaxID=1120568 RepID=UPI00067CC9D1